MMANLPRRWHFKKKKKKPNSKRKFGVCKLKFESRSFVNLYINTEKQKRWLKQSTFKNLSGKWSYLAKNYQNSVTQDELIRSS